jgi:hypothetical protein
MLLQVVIRQNRCMYHRINRPLIANNFTRLDSPAYDTNHWWVHAQHLTKDVID